MNNKELIKLANEVKENAYVPFSKFKVGAALETENGEIFVGCNVENSTYGATNCAERTAIFSAVANGHTKFKKIAIMSSSGDYTPPCGICRQVMFEFMGNDGIIILGNENDTIKEYTVKELLPLAFKL